MIHFILELLATGVTGYVIGRFRAFRKNRERK